MRNWKCIKAIEIRIDIFIQVYLHLVELRKLASATSRVKISERRE